MVSIHVSRLQRPVCCHHTHRNQFLRAAREIRTHNFWILSPAPLPIGLERQAVKAEDSNLFGERPLDLFTLTQRHRRPIRTALFSITFTSTPNGFRSRSFCLKGRRASHYPMGTGGTVIARHCSDDSLSRRLSVRPFASPGTGLGFVDACDRHKVGIGGFEPPRNRVSDGCLYRTWLYPKGGRRGSCIPSRNGNTAHWLVNVPTKRRRYPKILRTGVHLLSTLIPPR